MRNDHEPNNNILPQADADVKELPPIDTTEPSGAFLANIMEAFRPLGHMGSPAYRPLNSDRVAEQRDMDERTMRAIWHAVSPHSRYSPNYGYDSVSDKTKGQLSGILDRFTKALSLLNLEVAPPESWWAIRQIDKLDEAEFDRDGPEVVGCHSCQTAHGHARDVINAWEEARKVPAREVDLSE